MSFSVARSTANPGGSHKVASADVQRELRKFILARGDHVQRYRFAFSLMHGSCVLDFGSGSGLGALLLPGLQASYLGVEIDVTALNWAASHLSTPDGRVRFISGPEFDSQSLARSFDLALILEVIEHVRNPEELVSKVARCVRSGGTIVISTPNGAISDGDPRVFQSPFHLEEFDIQRFRSILDVVQGDYEIFKQFRRDHLDVAPLLIGAGLLRGTKKTQAGGHTAPPGRVTSNPAWRIWELLPSPSPLWKITRAGDVSPRSRGYSHLIGVVKVR